MKKRINKLGLSFILAVSFALLPQINLDANNGCGNCWQNGVKSATWSLFKDTFILCNCETAKGQQGSPCTCFGGGGDDPNEN